MSKNRSAVLILCMSTVCLSGCDLLRVTGPCYGVGCPSRTAGGSGQYKPGEAPKAQNTAAPAPAKSAAAPTQSALPAAKPAAAQSASVSPSAQSAATQSSATASTTPQATTAQPSSAQAASAPAATVQPAPAQNASVETKPSPFHAIGEFFGRLIPHHNSGANSGASN
jgi:hypothetical protein